MTKKEETSKGRQDTPPRFAEFLVSRDIITKEAALEALNWQQKEAILIGKICLHEEKLTTKQVLQILDAKTETPKKFGDLAVELGFLNRDEAEELLRKQKKLKRPIGQLLVQLQEINQEALKRELEAYSQLVQEYKNSK